MSQLAEPEMTYPSRRRIFSAQHVPVSIAVLFLFLPDTKTLGCVHGLDGLRKGTVSCKGSEPCVHQAQQGHSVTSNNHRFRATVEVPITPKYAPGLDPTDPCPTTGLFGSGPRPTSVGIQASRDGLDWHCGLFTMSQFNISPCPFCYQWQVREQVEAMMALYWTTCSLTSEGVTSKT